MIENACFQTLYVLFPVLHTVSVLRAVMPAPTANPHYLIPEMKIENRLRMAAAEAAVRRVRRKTG